MPAIEPVDYTESLMADRGMPPGYEVLGELGRGGFGEVVLARHTTLDRLVAIKRIPVAALHYAEAVARFQREARVLAALDHPGIVAVYDFRLGPLGAALIMEYVPGQSLRQALDRGPLSPALATAILVDVAAALAAAADRGIVHRDVKPANVFLLAGGAAKLGDFGIARAADPSLFRTAAGMLTGTPAYLPPESLLDGNEPDRHADDYSFAVMAYEMLLGVLPFQGEGLELLGQHGHRPPRPPHEVQPGVPPAAAAALLAGLAKDPFQRLPAVELAARLRTVPASDWPAAESDLPRAPANVTLLGALPPRQSTSVTSPPGRGRGRTSRRTVLTALLAFVAVVGGAAGGLVLGARDDPILRVEDVQVRADRRTGNCPSAEYRFVATVRTDGAGGDLTMRWARPDGQRTEITTVAVPQGRREVEAELRFSVSGRSPLTGTAQLQVLTPQPATSPMVRIDYACP